MNELEKHFEEDVYKLFVVHVGKFITKYQIVHFVRESMTEESALKALQSLVDKGLVVELKDMLEITDFENDQEITTKASLYKMSTPHEIAKHKLDK